MVVVAVVGTGAVLVSAEVVVTVLVVVDVFVEVVVVVVGSVVEGGPSASADAATPSPKRSTVPSVAISFSTTTRRIIGARPRADPLRPEQEMSLMGWWRTPR